MRLALSPIVLHVSLLLAFGASALAGPVPPRTGDPEFENALVRVHRLRLAPGDHAAAPAGVSRLLVPLTEGDVRGIAATPGAPAPGHVAAGEARVERGGKARTLENSGSAPFEALAIDLLQVGDVSRVPAARAERAAPPIADPAHCSLVTADLGVHVFRLRLGPGEAVKPCAVAPRLVVALAPARIRLERPSVAPREEKLVAGMVVYEAGDIVAVHNLGTEPAELLDIELPPAPVSSLMSEP